MERYCGNFREDLKVGKCYENVLLSQLKTGESHENHSSTKSEKYIDQIIDSCHLSKKLTLYFFLTVPIH